MSPKLALSNSIRNGDLESFKHCFDFFKNPNFLFDSGESLLHLATAYNQSNIILFLVENGANINILNKEDNTPINSTILNNNLPCTKLLINHGATLELIDSDTILNVFKKNNIDFISLILSQNLTFVNSAFLRSTIDYLSLDSLKLFHSNNFDLFDTDMNGSSLLHSLSSSSFDSQNNLDCISYLVSQNLDVNLHNKHFATPLTLSMLNGNLSIFTHLLSLGADPHISNQLGDNILHLICKHNLSEFIPVLFQYDINLNNKNLLHQTPLDIATNQRYYPIVDMLNSYTNYKSLTTLKYSPIKDTINKNTKNKI